MKHLQKSLSLFLYIVMCLSYFPFTTAYAEEAESIEKETFSDDAMRTSIDDDVLYHGECGKTINWTIDKQGTLYISGTGEMYDYNYSKNLPSYTKYHDLPIMSSPKIKKYWALTNISTSSIFAKQSQIGMNSPRISCRIVSRGHGKPGIRLVRI